MLYNNVTSTTIANTFNPIQNSIHIWLYFHCCLQHVKVICKIFHAQQWDGWKHMFYECEGGKGKLAMLLLGNRKFSNLACKPSSSHEFFWSLQLHRAQDRYARLWNNFYAFHEKCKILTIANLIRLLSHLFRLK